MVSRDRRGPLIRDLLLGGFVVSGAVYLVWRLTAFNTEAPVFSSIFWGAEVLAYLAALVRLRVTRRANLAAPSPPACARWPMIDVFVTTYNEPIAIVRRTLAAAVAMDGAHRTWLLDDGDRADMAALARELGCDYLARAVNRGAKAGNLNHGLDEAQGELVAVFDADHAPERRFLTRLAGYFEDPALALVQTPQDYFNTDSFQHGRAAGGRNIWHEQSVFHWTEQPGRAAVGAATCCGCSMILRRAALDDIGGFPEETVTEDMHASVRLHRQGWKTLFHPEPLAFGLAPASPREFLRQRLRWGEGNMQVCRLEGVPFVREMSLDQNLAYLMLGTTYLEAWIKLVAYVAPIVFLFTFVPPIWADPAVFFSVFLPYLAIGLLAHVEFGRGYAPLLAMERFAMARLSAGLASTSGFFRRRIQFRVTDKTTGGSEGQWLLAPQALILVLGLAGIAYAGWRLWDINEVPPPFWVTVAVMVLALYNAGLAAVVLAGAVRTGRLAPGAWLCLEPLPVRIAGEAAIRTSAGLSPDLLVLRGPTLAGRPEAVELVLPVGVLRVPISAVERRGGRTLLTLAPGLKVRDAIEQCLYVGRWRRVLAGQSERRATWLEALRLLPAPARPPVWRIGVWWAEAGLLGGLAAVDGARVALFGEPPLGALSLTIDGERRDVLPGFPAASSETDLPLLAAGAGIRLFTDEEISNAPGQSGPRQATRRLA